MVNSLSAKLRKFKLNPSDREAFRSVVVELHAQERFDELADVYELRAGRVPKVEAVRLWMTVADVWGPRVEDPMVRARALENAVSAAWSEQKVFEILEEDFRRKQDLISLRFLLTQRATGSKEATVQAEAARELAEISESLGDIEATIDAWSAVARLVPEEGPAVVEYLEVLRRDVPDASAFIDPVIEEILRSQGDERELMRFLDQRLPVLQDPELVVAVSRELAELAWSTTADPELAVFYLSQAFERVPEAAQDIRRSLRSIKAHVESDHPDLLSLERRCATALEEWPRVIAALDREIALSMDVLEKAQLHMHAGLVQADHLNATRKALEHYQKAVEVDPSVGGQAAERLRALLEKAKGSAAEDVRRALHEQLYHNQDWQGVHGLLRQELEQTRDATRRADLLLDMAAFEAGELNSPERSIVSYMDAWKAAPDQEVVVERVIEGLVDTARISSVRREASDALLQVYEATDAWEEWAALQQDRVHHIDDDTARADLHFRIAEVLYGKTSRHDEALGHYEAALRIAPDHLDVVRRIADVYRSLEDAEQLMRLLEHELSLGADPSREAELECERMQLLHSELDNPAAALDIGYRAWRRLDARAVREAMVETLSSAADPAELVTLVASAYAEVNEVREAADLTWTSAELLGLESNDGAKLGLVAFTAGILEEKQVSRLRAALEARDVVDEQLEFYEVLSADESVPMDEAVRRFTRLADLQVAAGNDDEALVLYTRLIETRPDEEALYHKLMDVLTRIDDPGLLAEVYEAALVNLALDEQTAIGYMSSLRELYADTLDQEKRALECAARLLDLSPTDAETLAWVHEYAAGAGDYETLYTLLSATLDQLDPAEQMDRHVELAELAKTRLEDPARAADHYRQVVDSEHVMLDTRQEAAQSLLDHGVASDDRETVLAALAYQMKFATDDFERHHSLNRVLEDLEARESLALDAVKQSTPSFDQIPDDIYAAQQRLALSCDDKPAAVEAMLALRERGEHYNNDNLGLLASLMLATSTEVESAWEIAAEVLSEDPYHAVLIDAITAAPSPDHLPKLADTLMKRVEGLDEDDALPAMYLAADLMVLVPALSDQAEAYWRQVLDRRPEESRAMDALEAAIRARDGKDDLYALLQTKLERCEGEARVPVLRELAELTGEAEVREGFLKEVAELAPEDPTSFMALVEHYRATEQAEALADALDALIAVIDEPEERLRLRYLLAQLSASQLKDNGRAAAAYEALLDEHPNEEKALKKLERIYRKDDDKVALARTLTRRAKITESEDKQSNLHKEAAKALEAAGDLEGAAASMERLLKLEPKNLTALEELVRIHGELEAWNEQLEVLERIGMVSGMPELQAEVMVRAARVLHQHLEDSQGAFELLARSFEIVRPDDELLELARQAATESEQWGAWAGILHTLSHEMRDEAKRVAMEMEIAQIADQKLNQPEDGLRVLLDSHARNPVVGPVFELMEDIAKTHGLQAQIIAAYKALQSRADADPESVWRGLRGSAEVAETVAGKPEMAFALVATAFDEPSLHAQADETLVRLASQYNLWDKYAEHLGELWDEEEDVDKAVSYVIEKARIEDEKISSPDDAFQTLLGAYGAVHDHALLRDHVYRLADQLGRWEHVLRLCEVLLERTEPKDQGPLFDEISTILGVHLDSPERAFEARKAAYQTDFRNEDYERALIEAADALGREDVLIEAFQWAASQVARPDEQRGYLVRVAELAGKLGRHDEAMAAFETLFSHHPEDESLLEVFEATLTDVNDRAKLIPMIDEILVGVRRRPHKARWRLYQAQLAEAIGDHEIEASALQAALKAGADADDVRPRLLAGLAATKQWKKYIRAVQDEIAATKDGDRQVELFLDLHRVYLDELEDPDKATEILNRAARAVPNAEAIDAAMVEHLSAFEKWDDIIDYLVSRGHKTRDDDDRAALYYLEAARVADESLDAPRRTVRLVELVLRKKPDMTEALELKARAFAGLGRWMDHINTLKQLAEQLPAATAAHAYAQAAHAFEVELFYPDKALAMYDRAIEVAADPAAFVLEAARIEVDAGRHSQARDRLTNVLGDLESSDDGALVAQGLALLALCEEDQDPGTARELVDRALGIDPHNERALEAARRLGGQGSATAPPPAPMAAPPAPPAGPPTAPAEVLDAEVFDDDVFEEELIEDESFEVVEDESAYEVVEDESAYEVVEDESAYEVVEESLDVATGQFDRAAPGDDPMAEAITYFQDGQFAEAIPYFNAAIAHDPTDTERVEGLLACYEQAGSLSSLAADLELALSYIPETARTTRTTALWALGTVLFEHLDNPSAALVAYEELRAMRPDDPEVLKPLLAIYEDEEVGDDIQAMDIAGRLVGLAAFDEEMLRTLQRLYFAHNNLDGVVHTLAVLRLGHATTGQEDTILDRMPPQHAELEPGAMDDDVFVHAAIAHAFTPEIMAALRAAASLVVNVAAESADPSWASIDQGSPLAQVVAELAPAFSVQAHGVFIDPEQTYPIYAMLSNTPDFVVSPALARETDLDVLRFEVARALVYARPEFALHDYLGESDFPGFYAAVCEQLDGVPRAVARVEKWRDIVANAGISAVDQAMPSVELFEAMMNAAAIRLALIACGESDVAFRQILVEEELAPPANVDQLRELVKSSAAIRTLVSFVLSIEYLDARHALGLSVTNG